VVGPGAIHTEEFEAAGEEAKRRRAQTVPLGRVGYPEDIAGRSRSWPQTTPATSPARSSMSTAASWRSSARRRWMQACPNRSNAACAPDLIQPAHVGRFAAREFNFGAGNPDPGLPRTRVGRSCPASPVTTGQGARPLSGSAGSAGAAYGGAIVRQRMHGMRPTHRGHRTQLRQTCGSG